MEFALNQMDFEVEVFYIYSWSGVPAYAPVAVFLVWEYYLRCQKQFCSLSYFSEMYLQVIHAFP